MSGTTRIAWVGVTALLVFVAWISTDASASAGLAFFYAVPVGLAAWWGGGRAAVIAIAACCLLYVIGALVHPVPDFGVALAVRLLAFAFVAFAVTFVRRRLIVLEHSAEELEAIRAALTPSTLPEQSAIDAGAAFIPSEHGVSGDFYLLTNGADGSTIAIVGDVVGHGAQAARLATFIRARFIAFAANTSDPAELLMLANTALTERPGKKQDLVSAVCLRLQREGNALSWAVAGHPPPLRLPGLQELSPVGATFLLGADPGLELRTADTSLEDGGGVVVYTDGATDVRRGDDLLGASGLLGMLRPLAQFPATAMATEVEKAILDWADGPIRDDLCLLVLKPRAA